MKHLWLKGGNSDVSPNENITNDINITNDMNITNFDMP